MKTMRFVMAYCAITAFFTHPAFSQGCDQGLVINFNPNSSNLLSNEKKKLDELSTQLATMGEVYIEVYGNTDQKGTDEFNFNLAEKRIEQVSAYLKAAAKGRELDMKAFNFGETKLLFDGDDEALQAKNRRVEVHL